MKTRGRPRGSSHRSPRFMTTRGRLHGSPHRSPRFMTTRGRTLFFYISYLFTRLQFKKCSDFKYMINFAVKLTVLSRTSGVLLYFCDCLTCSRSERISARHLVPNTFLTNTTPNQANKSLTTDCFKNYRKTQCF